jgi:DNA-binding NarL/FixJ family response regulator
MSAQPERVVVATDAETKGPDLKLVIGAVAGDIVSNETLEITGVPDALPPMPDRLLRVLPDFAEGLVDVVIAYRAGLTLGSAKVYMGQIKKALGAKNMYEARELASKRRSIIGIAASTFCARSTDRHR